jgi:hypothetical protein
MTESEPVLINHDIPYIIKYNGVSIGFCLHHIAYITNPELANMYDASILFYSFDKLHTDELQLIQVTDQIYIDAAYAMEEFLHCAEASRDTCLTDEVDVGVENIHGLIKTRFTFRGGNDDEGPGTIKLIKGCENND